MFSFYLNINLFVRLYYYFLTFGNAHPFCFCQKQTNWLVLLLFLLWDAAECRGHIPYSVFNKAYRSAKHKPEDSRPCRSDTTILSKLLWASQGFIRGIGKAYNVGCPWAGTKVSHVIAFLCFLKPSLTLSGQSAERSNQLFCHPSIEVPQSFLVSLVIFRAHMFLLMISFNCSDRLCWGWATVQWPPWPSQTPRNPASQISLWVCRQGQQFYQDLI